MNNIHVEVTNNNPEPIIRSLRTLADMLESGECVVKQGGITINLFSDPVDMLHYYLEVNSDLVVEY